MSFCLRMLVAPPPPPPPAPKSTKWTYDANERFNTLCLTKNNVTIYLERLMYEIFFSNTVDPFIDIAPNNCAQCSEKNAVHCF